MDENNCNFLFSFKSAAKKLENCLEETEVNATVSMSDNNLVAVLYKPKRSSFHIYANDSKVSKVCEVIVVPCSLVNLPRNCKKLCLKYVSCIILLKLVVQQC